MKPINDKSSALAISAVALLITWYAIIVNTNSRLIPDSPQLQGSLIVILFIVPGILFVLCVRLVYTRKTLIYLVPAAASFLALFRVMCLIF